MSTIPHVTIKALIEDYLALYPEESGDFPVLLEQLQDTKTDIMTRKNFTGHVVADACIIDPRHKKILIIHHAKFQRWQNPGGHIDPEDESPSDAAVREALEETWVKVSPVLDEHGQPLLLHMNSHIIPDNPAKAEPEHWHHAMTFLFLGDSTKVLSKNTDAGVSCAEWMDMEGARQHGRLQSIIDKIELF